MRRFWGIRHLRFFWLSVRVHRWARLWGSRGIGLGIPNPADVAHLDRIWEGKA